MNPVVVIEDLSFSYPGSRKRKEPRQALRNISLSVDKGEIFCLLGPNGSGKSTLFQILSTFRGIQEGNVSILGYALPKETSSIRSNIGVVFQNPSLDKKLTARENLLHQGHLYGLRGAALEHRIEQVLQEVGIADRAHELIETLSGGMQRRVELAKSLLHKPALLLLDEPSTGLDPGARKEFGNYLKSLRETEGVTVLLTTHILDEAEHCDKIAIFDKGNLVALGTPSALKREIGGDVITVETKDSKNLNKRILATLKVQSQVVDGSVRIERANGHEFIPQIVQAFPGEIESITLSKPTLEDVFIDKTGHKFETEDAAI